jgi:hypothetical protein
MSLQERKGEEEGERGKRSEVLVTHHPSEK